MSIFLIIYSIVVSIGALILGIFVFKNYIKFKGTNTIVHISYKWVDEDGEIVADLDYYTLPSNEYIKGMIKEAYVDWMSTMGEVIPPEYKNAVRCEIVSMNIIGVYGENMKIYEVGAPAEIHS